MNPSSYEFPERQVLMLFLFVVLLTCCNSLLDGRYLSRYIGIRSNDILIRNLFRYKHSSSPTNYQKYPFIVNRNVPQSFHLDSRFTKFENLLWDFSGHTTTSLKAKLKKGKNEGENDSDSYGLGIEHNLPFQKRINVPSIESNRPKELSSYIPKSGATNRDQYFDEKIEALQVQISHQQQQIHRILEVLKSDHGQHDRDHRNSNGDRFNSLTSVTLTDFEVTQLIPCESTQTVPVFIFVDGTWLYYSIHERDELDCPIIARFGRAWQKRYRIDWGRLPGIIEDALWLQDQQQVLNQDYDNHSGKIDKTFGENDVTGRSSFRNKYKVVQTSVYTSYKAETPKTSYRYQMYQDMKELGDNSTYKVYMMETVGKSEKCVDIQLAVEMVHLASSLKLSHATADIVNKNIIEPLPVAVAVLLTGDKDFIPAMIRTRHAGMKLALCSMKRGCNRALRMTPNLKDYDDVIWLEDYLDRLITFRDTQTSSIVSPINAKLNNLGSPDSSKQSVSELYTENQSQLLECSAQISMYTLTKVINDFIITSGCSRVISRDMGRYLKSVIVPTIGSILHDIKTCHGGLRQFLTVSGNIYHLEDVSYKEDSLDHSYWISFRHMMNPEEVQQSYLKSASLSEAEKVFFEKFYSIEPLRRNYEIAYQRTLSELERHHQSSPLDTRLPQDNASLENMTPDKSSTDYSITNKSHNPADNISSEKPKGYYKLFQAYNTLTLEELKNVCRKKELHVSGRKAELIDRIVLHMMNLEQGSKSSIVPQNGPQKKNHHGDNFVHEKDQELSQYLQSLIKEYLQASSGQASSRNVGRYLAANRALRKKPDVKTALQEMKIAYGSLGSFLSTINKMDSAFIRTEITTTNYGIQNQVIENQIALNGNDSAGFTSNTKEFLIKLRDMTSSTK